jgi:hypothetical protein
VRQFKPNSEFELSLVRRMAVALFQHDRLTTSGTEAMQREIDSIVREFPALGLSEHSFRGQKRAISSQGTPTVRRRGQRQHQTACNGLLKRCSSRKSSVR